MNHKSLLYYMVFFAMLSACSPSLRVTDGTAEPRSSLKNYFGYYLPKTLLKIKVPIEKAEFKAGLVSKLTAPEKKILLKHVYVEYGWLALDENEDKFSIGEKIQFIPLTVPDEKKYFTLQYSSGKALSNSMGLVLNKDGIITSGEFAQENKTFEYVTKGVELLAHTASIFMGLGDKSDDHNAMPFQGIQDTSKEVSRVRVLLKELNSLTATKADLIKSPTNAVASNEPLKYRTELIDKRILQIKEEILGKYKKTVYNLSLIFEPGSDGKDEEMVTLLKLDGKNGIMIPKMDKEDPGKPGIGDITATNQTAPKELTISIKQIYRNKLPATNFTASKAYGSDHFLVYNVPAKYSIALLYDKKPLKSFISEDDEKGTDQYEVYFPQRGKMAALPLDFKEMKAVFVEDLGFIKEIKSSKATDLNAANVSSAITALDSLMTLRYKIKESKKEKPVEDGKEEAKEQVIRLIVEQATPNGTTPAGQ